MLKLAARALGLLPYRLRAGCSGVRPSGPSGPKERSGQPMARGATRQRSRASDGNPTSAEDLPPRDRDRGALNRSVANQSVAEEHHPSKYTQNQTRSARATRAIWGNPHLEQESVQSRISAAASPPNQTRRCQRPSAEREAMSRPGSGRWALVLGDWAAGASARRPGGGREC
jgi:hypothetical protein